jgi:flagella basal body P-ring formation protein FlgA
MLQSYCGERKRKVAMAVRNWRYGLVAAGFLGAVLGAPGAADAAATEDLAMLRNAVEAAVRPRLAALNGVEYEVSVGALDERLRLPACADPDIAVPPANAATISVKVSCAAPAWVIYVPVRIHAWVEAVVAATNLAPNTPLSARDLTRGRVDAFAGNPGLLTDPREAEGKILRTGLAMGAPLRTPLLDLPIAVHRGQKVVLTLRDPMMTIKATAVALQDGRVGENIAVENPETRKTLHATVDRDGGVELRF